MNLFITFLFGMTILIGVILVVILKNSKTISELSISIGFSVLLYLIFLELIPHVFEHLPYMDVLFYAVIGIILLKLLDFFIPEHEHKDSDKHTLHISLIASIALVLHNIIEGMALYTTLNNHFHIGLMMGLGVGFHNIPMGMVIASTLEDSKYSKKKIILIGTLISLSTVLGALIINLFGRISDYSLGVMLALTLGMIVYITIFELFQHMKHQSKKNNLIGLIIGTIIFLISMLFHSH
ncbi:MAG: ZIP family metal transporter [Firmicutes bacterium]|nr:ZIP family metal transporter [Bacillota bacterium]